MWAAEPTGALAAVPREAGEQVTALVLAGLCGWSAIAYALHRFFLHGLAPFRQWRPVHRERQAALIRAPTILWAGLILGLVFVPAATGRTGAQPAGAPTWPG